MEIIEVEIDKIKPDPNQPRTSIDEIDLREMAVSIVTEGVINPIEVDNDNMIITGERRWRASKIAGLKKVPVKRMVIDKDGRFMRQVIENIHHNTMSDDDTAHALRKLLELEHKKTGKDMGAAPISPRNAERYGKTRDLGVTWLAKKTGKSRRHISYFLNYLDEQESFRVAIKEKKISETFIPVMIRASDEFKDVVEKKLLKNEFKTRDMARDFVAALNREKDNPEKVKELIKIDYSEFKDGEEALDAIKKISPRINEKIMQTYEPTQELTEIIDKLKGWIIENPRKDVGEMHIAIVTVNMNFAKHLIESWLSGEEKKLLDK